MSAISRTGGPLLKKSQWIEFLILSTIFMAACSNSSNTETGEGQLPTDKKTGKTASTCVAQPVLEADVTGGCHIRLVTPTHCELIDLSAGKTYEFAWTTDGTTCETPFKLIAAGNPVTNDNVFEFTINTNGAEITTKGGIINVTAADLEAIPTTDGSFHWVVQSFHGSHPASQQFRVKK